MALRPRQLQITLRCFDSALGRQHIWTCLNRRLAERLHGEGQRPGLAVSNSPSTSIGASAQSPSWPVPDWGKKGWHPFPRSTHRGRPVDTPGARWPDPRLKLHFIGLKFNQIPFRSIARAHTGFNQAFRVVGQRQIFLRHPDIRPRQHGRIEGLAELQQLRADGIQYLGLRRLDLERRRFG